MKYIANYLLTFLLFGFFMYILLPYLRKGLTKDQRIQKAAWAAILFTAAKLALDLLFP